MIIAVEVGVALARPPRCDRLSRVIVSVPSPPTNAGMFKAEQEARLIATQIAGFRPDVVMPVSATIVEILEL